MKLFLIASVWLTGLFVVIAAVTMVAMATGASTGGAASLQKRTANGQLAGDTVAGGHSRTGDHGQAGQIGTSHGRPGQQPADHRPAGQHRAGPGQAGGNRTYQSGDKQSGPAGTRPSAPTQIHAVYIHTGSANTSSFTIGGSGTWKLTWSYDCAGPGGAFTVSQGGTSSADGPSVTRRGTAGHGVTWAYNDAGTHYLAVRTQCRWRITVTSQS
jgi:hypothetical protein